MDKHGGKNTNKDQSKEVRIVVKLLEDPLEQSQQSKRPIISFKDFKTSNRSQGAFRI